MDCSTPGFPAAAAAKSLQSCLTLCDPIPGILQARTLEWVAISFSNAWKWKVKVKSLSQVRWVKSEWTSWPHGLQPTRLPHPSITNSWSLLKLMSIKSVMPFNHLILCHPLLLLPSVFPSIRVFSNESVLLIRWPKYWSFSFSISPSNEYSGLMSFRIDWISLGLYDFCHTTTQIAHQHIYIYPSLLSLPTIPPPSQPFRSAQRTGLGSLLYTAASHWLCILHMVAYR